MGTDAAGYGLVLVGAGSGTRLGTETRKAWVLLHGRPLWWHAARAFRAHPPGCAVLVVHPEDLARCEGEEGRRWLAEAEIHRVVVGGADRQASVAAGLQSLSDSAPPAPALRDALVHDAARPFLAPGDLERLLEALSVAPAALLAAPATSTVKRGVGGAGGSTVVAGTLDRKEIWLAQTPQGARLSDLLAALSAADAQGQRFTDEAAALEAHGLAPILVPGSEENFKVTTPDDLARAERLMIAEPPRVGHGYDIHRTEAGGPLRLGGIDIPASIQLVGHSDADAVLHAVTEALLGATGGSDIGEHFPPTDERWRGADSALLLTTVIEEIREQGFKTWQVDVSVIAEAPKLGVHKARMKARLAELLDLPPDRVAVKARTGEKVGPVGRGEAIEVICTAQVLRLRQS